ncbi:MAG: uracil-DNA glycosylase [Vicinamibacterales bacterium]
MDVREQLIAHLQFFHELGVEGLNLPASAPRARALGSARSSLEAAAAKWAAGAAGYEGDALSAPHGGEQSSLGPSSPSLGPRSSSLGPDRESLACIRADLGDCERCKLHRLGRRQIVFGVGSPNAALMFVGEAPGYDEDIQGFPFVGRAGQLLTRMIEAIDLKREAVYIANVIKCRPPENRNPEPDEVAACEPFLFRQVQSVQPRVIVALGTFAARALLRSQDAISRLRGRVYKYGGAKLVPTFHPAYLLRNPASKREAWEDLKLVRKLLAEG